MIVTIFGGSGFVGRYVAQRLAKRGHRIRVAVRRPNEALFVRPYGVPGQVEPVLANIRNDDSVAEAVRGADAVVNCTGILVETRRRRFEDVHAKGADRIAAAAAESGAKKLVHVSAIGADPGSASAYAASKADGEAAVLARFPGAIILRPSIVFGPEDKFFNRFASMARLSPVIPLVGSRTRFQPVFVGDVAQAAEVALEAEASPGVYELGGPDIEDFRGLMRLMLQCVRRKRALIPMVDQIAAPLAFCMDMLQIVTLDLFVNNLLTRDQVRLLGADNVVSEGAMTLSDLGIEATPMSAVLESYLYCYRPAGQFTAIHESADMIGTGAER